VDPASPRASSPGGDTEAPADAGKITPETYLGTKRGRAGPGLITYPEPAPLATGDVRLAGRWFGEEEKVTAGDAGAAIVLAYRANEVNLVMTPPRTGAIDVTIELDGRPLAPGFRTEDTVVDAAGATFVHVDHDGMYRLVQSAGIEEHKLRLVARQPEVAAFAFTFGP
jgi:hypothetical protein